MGLGVLGPIQEVLPAPLLLAGAGAHAMGSPSPSSILWPHPRRG